MARGRNSKGSKVSRFLSAMVLQTGEEERKKSTGKRRFSNGGRK